MPCSWGFNKLVIKPVESQSSNTWQLIVTDSCIGLYQLVSYVSSQLFPYILKILISQSIQLSNIREPSGQKDSESGGEILLEVF
jgi:hypothetical protein